MTEVTVTQADREAAARHFEGVAGSAWSTKTRAGLNDRSHLVQALARHREEAIADLKADNERLRKANERLRETLGKFAAVSDEFDRWQAKGSTTLPESVRFGYGQCRFGLADFQKARTILAETNGEGM